MTQTSSRGSSQYTRRKWLTLSRAVLGAQFLVGCSLIFVEGVLIYKAALACRTAGNAFIALCIVLHALAALGIMTITILEFFLPFFDPGAAKYSVAWLSICLLQILANVAAGRGLALSYVTAVFELSLTCSMVPLAGFTTAMIHFGLFCLCIKKPALRTYFKPRPHLRDLKIGKPQDFNPNPRPELFTKSNRALDRKPSSHSSQPSHARSQPAIEFSQARLEVERPVFLPPPPPGLDPGNASLAPAPVPGPSRPQQKPRQQNDGRDAQRKNTAQFYANPNGLRSTPQPLSESSSDPSLPENDTPRLPSLPRLTVFDPHVVMRGFSDEPRPKGKGLKRHV